jgi:hypothetical protein
MVDLTKLSDAELQALSSGDLTNLSDKTLRMITGEAEAPSIGAQIRRAAGLGARAVV